ncbi:MAG: NAD(P)-dependent alcohol dehydrogenase [Cryobacterium sp.]|nr:NAD(P)-dependent alcohol dehydrogenase [Cryobacterium sp.]
MKAVVQDKYGWAEVLQVREVGRPEPAAGEVLVRVRAASLNMADWHLMAGEPTIMRLGFGFGRPKSPTRGSDVAGVIEQIGTGVTELAVGDEVFGSASGTFAEFAVAKVGRLVLKPATVSFEHAAATPMAGYTALQAVRDSGMVQTGQRVLVTGAGGGVGSFAVQLAKHFGAHVTGVCSTAKIELVSSLGADAVIDYTAQPLVGEFDVIIDTGGGRSLSVLRSHLTPRGIAVLVGDESGSRTWGPIGRTLQAAMWSPFVGQKLIGLLALERQADLVDLAELLESGAIAPTIDRVFPLDETRDAMARLAAGSARGKLVVVP